MASDLLRIVREELLDKGEFSREDTLLVGISGGPDSLCLLDLLTGLPFTLVAAHLNHGLRSDSGADAVWLRSFVEARGILFRAGSEDVRAYADAHRSSIEEASRHLRYRFLFNQAEECGARAVLVGHHAGDQVETVLMHLLRGAGLQGLRGIQKTTYLPAYSENIPLIRPLLYVKRSEILDYCRERKLEPIYDETNQDLTILRNRIRLELLPYLETFNPRIREILQRSAQVLEGEYQIVREALDQASRLVIEGQSPDWVQIRRDAFLGCDQPVRRGLVREIVARLLPDLRDLSFENTELVVSLIKSPPRSGSAALISGLNLLHEDNFVWIFRDPDSLPIGRWPQISPGRSGHLEVPGRLDLLNGWGLEAALEVDEGVQIPSVGDQEALEFRVTLDADEIQLPLIVRARQPGDRFAPLGMNGQSQKVSDFMINEKIPLRAREAWPLVLSGTEICWVVGYRLSHSFRTGAGTRSRLQLSLTEG